MHRNYFLRGSHYFAVLALVAFITVVGSIPTHAQPTSKAAIKAAYPDIPAKAVHYYNGDMKIEAVVALDEVAIKDSSSNSRVPEVSAVSASLNTDAVAEITESRTALFVRYKSAMKLVDLNAEVNRAGRSLTNNSVYPVLYRTKNSSRTIKDKTILTNQLAVKLKDGGPTLDEILKAHSASVVEKVTYSPETYILSVSGADAFAALKAANALYESGDVEFAAPSLLRERAKRAFVPNDPLYSDQWHLTHTGQVTGAAGNDINIVGAWNNDYTGSGVNIGITDDGMEYTHPDLAANSRTDIDFDYFDGDNDPAPDPNFDFHGTSCAGIAAAVGGNSVGVTGAAPEATLIGIRAIVAASSDSVEAGAMGHNISPASAGDRIDINSNSWGPPDTSSFKETFGSLTLAAVENGIANGRGGLGTIYVWAAGNGRSANDNVNYDGYASSRYTIAVGATGGNGVFSSYSEPGASMLVNSPSSYSGAGTTTVDLVGSNGYNNSSDYTDDFGGTSSACPLAAGVIALILEANPNLTWRDVQHILVQTSEKNDPGNSDWTTNGAGLEFNHNYGFGRTDASAAVAAAETWTTVPDNEAPLTASSSSVISIPESVTGAITASDSVSISAPAEFATEHVEVIFNATHTWRGDIAVSLTSPDGTVSRLSEPHLGDSANNYNNWMFTTVANWGENPNGTWTLTFYDGATGDTGNVTGWTLNVHGFLTTVPDSATQWESYD